MRIHRSEDWDQIVFYEGDLNARLFARMHAVGYKKNHSRVALVMLGVCTVGQRLTCMRGGAGAGAGAGGARGACAYGRGVAGFYG